MYYIGMMSGTSMDAVDAALVKFESANNLQIMQRYSLAMPLDIKNRLVAISHQQQPITLSKLGLLEQQLTLWYAKAVQALLDNSELPRQKIRAIGCHGQTVCHEPLADPAYTIQLVAGACLAAQTGCTVVTDFRNSDMAVGGQGAPLAPAFHHGVFTSLKHHRIVANIGGIANITILKRQASADEVIGFDTGPGNGLMDAWIQRHQGKPYDQDGHWATQGQVNTKLLKQLLADDYIQANIPKSTGREYFNLDWLEAKLAFVDSPISACDVQATLCAFTAQSIAEHIQRFGPGFEQVLICGGGLKNAALLRQLKTALAPRTVCSSGEYGLDPQWVEAAAFAWLAKQRIEKRAGNLCSVTGAKRSAILGAVYEPAL